MLHFFFFFKQKTAYELRISDWSSDVCSSDLHGPRPPGSSPASKTQPPPAPMKVLGIESSCDETGVAVYDTALAGAAGLRAHAVYSQIALHAQYGGVVPEPASRGRESQRLEPSH